MVTLVNVPRYIALLKNYGSKPTLTKWLKNDGEVVEQGQPLVVVETTKTSLEIEAPASGNLLSTTNRGPSHHRRCARNHRRQQSGNSAISDTVD